MFDSERVSFPAYAVSVVPGRMVAATAVAIASLIFLSVRPAAAQAMAEYGHAASASASASTSAGTGLNALGKKIGSSMASDTKSTSAPASHKRAAGATRVDNTPEYSPQEVETANRHVLEQRAGQDAAKLNFKSVPANAVVRIDGKPVGLTPLLMSLAPGTYQIEMQGPRMEFGKQQLTLGAKETRDMELRLSAAPRYPTHITLQ